MKPINNTKSLLDAIGYHREVKRKCKEWNKKHYSGLTLKGHRRKKPWYMITTGKQFNYEERKMNWGAIVDYFRVPSQAAKAYDKTIIKKTTREQYKQRLIKAKLDDWIKNNPCPVDTKSIQKDLFEDEYLPKWEEAKEKALENISNIVENIGKKVVVYAHYKKDTGYNQEVMKLKSDGKKLMTLNGAYVNYASKSIRRAQKCANLLAKDCNFVSLMVVDGNQKCILIPHKPLNKAA